MASAPLATDEGDAFPDDAVEVARIVGVWGVKGWVKVQPYAKDPQALFSSTRWFVKPPQGPASIPPGGWPSVLRIAQAKSHGDGVVASIRDLDDRSYAESLRGARIFVARDSFPTPQEDEFYWVDLIGLRVVNRDQLSLGTVEGLLDTGAHSVLRVTADEPDEPERLIPFVGAYIDRVDLPGRCIHVDWGADY
jgi:16S rRNA processing protein RimM